MILDVNQNYVPNNTLKEKNKNVKKQEVKNPNSNYVNSKYSKKSSNQTPVLNNNFNQKKRELNIELPEEDEVIIQNNFLNLNNNNNNINSNNNNNNNNPNQNQNQNIDMVK